MKLEDLQLKNTNPVLILNILLFLELKKKSFEHYKKITDLLIESSDDEFSYSLDSKDDLNLYFKNVPRILESKYKDFTYKTVELLTHVRSYKGYNIYELSDKEFYYSRHILTTKSYGRKYGSIDECITKIDSINEPINKLSLIELKTRGERSVVYLPNHFLPGLIIKSLNMKFKSSLLLNKAEQELIYNSGLNDGNNLSTFYKYVLGITDNSTKDSLSAELQRVIDTPEKAACFIYALNSLEGQVNRSLKMNKIMSIIEQIKEKENDYEYFVVEEVGDPILPPTNSGIKRYHTTKYNKSVGVENIPKKVRKYVITLIQSAEVNNSLVSTDVHTGRLLPSIRVLNDLATKIQDKLGVTIHVETQSSLESLFESWGLKFTEDIRGFVKDGEIYINSSNATFTDIFHEYTHIMLGVLKAKNYDNYVDLVNIIANSRKARFIRKAMSEKYSNLALQDLNEEVFVEMFALYLSGKRFNDFLDGNLDTLKQAVDDKMSSVFGKQKLTENFYNTSLENIFSLFGHDLNLLMLEGNGLELQTELDTGKFYRRASTWIEGQIQKYKDSKGEIGISEKCD